MNEDEKAINDERLAENDRKKDNDKDDGNLLDFSTPQKMIKNISVLQILGIL